jgi:hypothetical protein
LVRSWLAVVTMCACAKIDHGLRHINTGELSASATRAMC